MGPLDQKWFNFGWFSTCRIMVRIVHRVGIAEFPFTSRFLKKEGALFCLRVLHFVIHSGTDPGTISGSDDNIRDTGSHGFHTTHNQVVTWVFCHLCIFLHETGKATGLLLLESLRQAWSIEICWACFSGSFKTPWSKVQSGCGRNWEAVTRLLTPPLNPLGQRPSHSCSLKLWE